MLRTALAALCAVAGGAQAPLLDLHLAADEAADGPPAWTWLRHEVLPRLPGWPPDRDPAAAVRLRFDRSARCTIAGGADPGDDYLRALVALRELGTVRVACAFSGEEIWEADGAAAANGRIARLLVLLGLDRGGALSTFDAAAVVGNLAPATIHGDPLGRTLTMGAAVCGDVAVMFWRDEHGTHVRGRSEGGLLLPAALCVLADRGGAPPTGRGLLAGARPPDEVERWVLLARAAVADDRAEAVRQLARFDDPSSGEALIHLLRSDAPTRLAAMDSIARRGAVDALPRVVSAAPAAGPRGHAMAMTAAATLWPRADPATRALLRANVPVEWHGALDGLGARPADDDPHPGTARRLLWMLLLASTAVILGLLRRG